MKKRMVVAATAAATVAVALSAGSASAADYIYWTGAAQSSSIGRANLDGSGVNEDFVASAGSMPSSVMVNDSNVFWLTGMNSPFDFQKANLDGSGVATVGQTPAGLASLRQVTLQGSYFYFPGLQGKASRLGITGSPLDSGFSSAVFQGAVNFDGVASSSSYLYLRGPNGSSIGRLTIDGNTPDGTFITGISPSIGGMAVTDSYIYWTTSTGIGRAPIGGGSPDNTFITGLSNVGTGIAVGGGHIYWGWGIGAPGAATRGVGRAKLDGTDVNANFITGLTKEVKGVAITPGAGSTPAPTPAPAPAPTPTPTPAATTLATPTVNTSAPGENAVVTVKTQLGPKGKYTFIFEKPTSNEMSREQATSNRVPMQKGSRIGTRRLKKTYTAAVITTTADNAKVVTRALLRKAQAKKLNLRVVYAPTGTAQSESVFKIK